MIIFFAQPSRSVIDFDILFQNLFFYKNVSQNVLTNRIKCWRKRYEIIISLSKTYFNGKQIARTTVLGLGKTVLISEQQDNQLEYTRLSEVNNPKPLKC